MRNRWRVAVLDSGLADSAIAPGSGRSVVASCRFVDNGREVVKMPARSDATGHGTKVAEVICGGSGSVDLLNAQVLDHRGVTTAAALVSAIEWSLDEGADLIHMSLGLREDRRVLAMAVERALTAGRVVVASTPARGEGTFPARYPCVLRATGDARCERDEISALNSVQADFGGCPRHIGVDSGAPAGSGRFGGASLGAAHLTRFLVGRIAPGSEVTAVRAQLQPLARYQGIEMRRNARGLA